MPTSALTSRAAAECIFMHRDFSVLFSTLTECMSKTGLFWFLFWVGGFCLVSWTTGCCTYGFSIIYLCVNTFCVPYVDITRPYNAWENVCTAQRLSVSSLGTARPGCDFDLTRPIRAAPLFTFSLVPTVAVRTVIWARGTLGSLLASLSLAMTSTCIADYKSQ